MPKAAAPSLVALRTRASSATHGTNAFHYVDPITGRPFPWEFHRGREKIRVAVSGRLTVNNVGTTLGACAAGYGIAQILALGTEDLLNRGKLVELFPDWPDERFPLYMFYLSRHVPPAKLRAFVDFVVHSVANT